MPHNAAINIKNRAVGHPVLKARRLLSNSRIGRETYTVLFEYSVRVCHYNYLKHFVSVRMLFNIVFFGNNSGGI